MTRRKTEKQKREIVSEHMKGISPAELYTKYNVKQSGKNIIIYVSRLSQHYCLMMNFHSLKNL